MDHCIEWDRDDLHNPHWYWWLDISLIRVELQEFFIGQTRIASTGGVSDYLDLFRPVYYVIN